MSNSSQKRSLAKAVSWRIIAISVLSIITWITTGDLKSVGYIAVLHSIVQTFTYFLHERLWNTVKWGKE